MLLALVAGVLFAFAALAVARALGPEGGRVILQVLLGAAAGIYLGPALADENFASVLLQSLGVALFCGVALLGARSLRLLGVAWMLHATWDLAHVVGELKTSLPEWYPWACIVADVALGGFLATFGLGPPVRTVPTVAAGAAPAPPENPS